jgi:hypothetical protein
MSMYVHLVIDHISRTSLYIPKTLTLKPLFHFSYALDLTTNFIVLKAY